MTDFAPARFLAGPHAQTLWGRLSRSRRLVSWRRESLETPDGDELLLDHAEPPGAPCFRLLVLLWRLAWRSPARLRLHHVVSGWDALRSSTTRQQDSLSSSASLRQHHVGSGKVAPSYAWFLGHPKDELKNILLLATQIKIRFTWPNAPFLYCSSYIFF